MLREPKQSVETGGRAPKWEQANNIPSVDKATDANPSVSLSEQASRLNSQGKTREALDVHYEDLVRAKTGGTSQVINGREIDSVTDTSLIQVKRVYTAVDKPENFLNKATRNQIKATIEMANQQGKTAEFWFKYGVSDKVRITLNRRAAW